MTDEPQLAPTEAATTLAARMADRDWAGKFLSGSGPQVAEYQKLSALAIKSDDKVELAMAGQYLPVNDSEHLARMGAASILREVGLTDDVIRQAITGQPVSQAEHDAATRRKDALMRDQNWVKEYLAGNGSQREEMSLLQIQSSPVKESAA